MMAMLAPLPVSHDQTHYAFIGEEHFAIRHSWNCFLRWRTDLGAMTNCDIHHALEALDGPPVPEGDYLVSLWAHDPGPHVEVSVEVVIDGHPRWLVLTRVTHAEGD